MASTSGSDMGSSAAADPLEVFRQALWLAVPKRKVRRQRCGLARPRLAVWGALPAPPPLPAAPERVGCCRVRSPTALLLPRRLRFGLRAAEELLPQAHAADGQQQAGREQAALLPVPQLRRGLAQAAAPPLRLRNEEVRPRRKALQGSVMRSVSAGPRAAAFVRPPPSCSCSPGLGAAAAGCGSPCRSATRCGTQTLSTSPRRTRRSWVRPPPGPPARRRRPPRPRARTASRTDPRACLSLSVSSHRRGRLQAGRPPWPQSRPCGGSTRRRSLPVSVCVCVRAIAFLPGTRSGLAFAAHAKANAKPDHAARDPRSMLRCGSRCTPARSRNPKPGRRSGTQQLGEVVTKSGFGVVLERATEARTSGVSARRTCLRAQFSSHSGQTRARRTPAGLHLAHTHRHIHTKELLRAFRIRFCKSMPRSLQDDTHTLGADSGAVQEAAQARAGEAQAQGRQPRGTGCRARPPHQQCPARQRGGGRAPRWRGFPAAGTFAHCSGRAGVARRPGRWRGRSRGGRRQRRGRPRRGRGP